MESFSRLFLEIEKNHFFEPCVDKSEINDFVIQHNFQLPDDMKAFYRKYRTVILFPQPDGDFTYRFVPIQEIHPTRIDIYCKDSDELGPKNWLTICDVGDGNYIAIDIASQNGDEWNFIDCFHETFAQPGQSEIVAKSFIELLEKALYSDGEKPFFLQKGFIGYGDGMPLIPENASIRIENPDAPEHGWMVRFSYNRKPYSKFFKDNEFGGKEAAFEAVKRYIDGVINENSRISQRPISR